LVLDGPAKLGRDDEKPMHRVWVDAFELAAYQVHETRSMPAFLAAMSYPQSGCWNDPNFNHPKMACRRDIVA